MNPRADKRLRRGWTTGACATAATTAAYTALLTGKFPDPVTIELPKGRQPSFKLDSCAISDGCARAGVVKDAGDDPDVTHGATVWAMVERGKSGSGVRFIAGEGVGMVTKPGLPIEVGEPAINPAPRRMIERMISATAKRYGGFGDVDVTVGIENGRVLAVRTWNPRLGIEGGLSVLGTTGVVIPYSCSAWIHSIHRGIDVARATGTPHVAACTGSTSEITAQRVYGLPDHAMLDMGDFVGPLIKYLNKHPVSRLTVAGGFAKMSKLATGAFDLHSSRSLVDFHWLASKAGELGASGAVRASILDANTALEALSHCQREGIRLDQTVATGALDRLRERLIGPVAVDVLVVDRAGNPLATAPSRVD